MTLESTITLKLLLTTGEEIENKWEELSARNGCVYDTDDSVLLELFSTVKSGNDILNVLEQLYSGNFRYTHEDGTIKPEYNNPHSLRWVSENIKIEQRIATIDITEIITVSIQDDWDCDGMHDSKILEYDYVDGSMATSSAETGCPSVDDYLENWNQILSWLEKFSTSQKIDMLQNMGFESTLNRSNNLDAAFEEVFREEFFFGNYSDADEFIEDFEGSL